MAQADQLGPKVNGAVLQSSNIPGELLQLQHHDDNSINTVIRVPTGLL